MNFRAKASAPAKVILLGKHFVVHGESALVLAINRSAIVSAELRKDRKIWIKSKTLKAFRKLRLPLIKREAKLSSRRRLWKG